MGDIQILDIQIFHFYILAVILSNPLTCFDSKLINGLSSDFLHPVTKPVTHTQVPVMLTNMGDRRDPSSETRGFKLPLCQCSGSASLTGSCANSPPSQPRPQRQPPDQAAKSPCYTFDAFNLGLVCFSNSARMCACLFAYVCVTGDKTEPALQRAKG